MIKLGRHQLETPAVCGAVISESVGAMRAGVEKAVKQGADLVELRLDGLRELAGWEELLRAEIPLILTNRPKREGGRFEGGEEERVKPLLEGISRGVSCVDIELSTEKRLLDRLVREAKKQGVCVLMSHHDFVGTPQPDALIKITRRMVEAGCDVAKVVTFAEKPRDAVRILDFLVQVQGEVRVPVVAFAMGEAGRLSRIAAPILDSPITYASVSEATAPSQFDVATTKRLLREFGVLR